ncbi:hypothetical protein CCZ01_03660 [Helicobacter monodelphidis]|uniref:TerB family tellurite resistance protein n=1 Tax=Helicobacter sp. 15-1451 TaxID=2004995 RepID=UPI000DCD53F2|nr:TerB family tellurite resistance protein [Helicobacter sp. 15-1451]RAX58181.1 hypothetical protein CCZ01_03660 [Helicobacter sp. 15-1451]
MEYLLLVIAVGVIFFMFKTLKEYLANPKSYGPLKNQEAEPIFDDPYADYSQKTDIEHSECGLILALIAKVVQSDGKVCEFEERLIAELINDMVISYDNQAFTQESLSDYFYSQKVSIGNVEEFALEFVDKTKGQYKKRLKVIEFLFVVAYADGVLAEEERETIIDIAAYFELSNEDFNRIYDRFEEFMQNKTSQAESQNSLESALQTFGLTEESEENITSELIKKRYRELVKKYHPDIIQGQGGSQRDTLKANEQLTKINDAYEILKDKYNKNANRDSQGEN